VLLGAIEYYQFIVYRRMLVVCIKYEIFSINGPDAICTCRKNNQHRINH